MLKPMRDRRLRVSGQTPTTHPERAHGQQYSTQVVHRHEDEQHQGGPFRQAAEDVRRRSGDADEVACAGASDPPRQTSVTQSRWCDVGDARVGGDAGVPCLSVSGISQKKTDRMPTTLKFHIMR